MARKIIWSPRAADDLDDICNFIARDSEQYAGVFARRVFSAVERLRDIPRSGRIVPEYQDSAIREVILGKYRIVYRLKTHAIELAAISHGSRILYLQ